MRDIIKRKILPCILIIFTLFLTGCTNQEYTLVVNSDDSADLTIRYIVDKDTYDLLSSYDIEGSYKFEQNTSSANEIERCDVLFQEAAAVFYDYGFKINPVNDSIEIGFEASKNYKTIDELNADIAKLYNDGLTNFNGEVTVDDSLLSKTYVFSGTVKYLLDPDAEVTDAEKSQILSLYDTSNLHAQVSLKMPGDLVDLDGTVEDSMARYTATYDDNEEVPVHLKTQIVNTLVRNIIFAVVIVIVVVGGFFISKNMKKKKEAQKLKDLYGDEEDFDEEY